MTAAVYSTDRTAPLRLFTGHISDVTAVCWHENGTLIATCGDDKTARLWDLRSGKGVRLFTGSPSPLSCVALSSSSPTTGVASLLASGSDTGAVCLWDVGSGRQLSVLQGHSDSVHSVSFSADGTALASGGADCSLRIFDVNLVMSVQTSFPSRSPSIVAVPSSSSRSSNYHSTLDYGTVGVPLVCQPRHTYHTKFSPVYFVDFSDKNLLFSGGPFSLYCATIRGALDRRDTDEEKNCRESVGKFTDKVETVSKTRTAARQTITATEQETAAALGLSQSTISS